MAASKPEFRLGKLLNRGSFGKIYESVNERGEVVGAVKLLKKDEKGIPCMLEISIMQTYSHDCLNGSLGIGEINDNILIMQNIAKHDLQKQIKLELPSVETHRIWCHRIAQGIDCLHDHGIIHCDMKPGNCLIFPNGDVKITDYTLSVLKKAAADTFCHHIGTLPFCPPEVLLGQVWAKPVDIWALGCTFYNLFTGQLLIPIQKSEDLKTLTDERRAKIMRSRTLSAIITWRKHLGDTSAQQHVAPEFIFNHVAMHERWYSLPEGIRQLIINMTSFDPLERPTVREIVTCKYFTGLPIYAMTILSTGASKLDEKIELQIERIVYKNLGNKDILDLTKELYARSNMPNSLIKVQACFWIASKVITGDTPDNILADNYELLAMERKICNYLGFRLHVKATGRLLQSLPSL